MMRGWITDAGDDEGLRLATDLPEPKPADDEAVVEVKAYRVNRREASNALSPLRLQQPPDAPTQAASSRPGTRRWRSRVSQTPFSYPRKQATSLMNFSFSALSTRP